MKMNSQQRFERIASEYSTTEELLKAISIAQSWVRIAFPNATKLVTTAENGVAVAMGIYDCALSLNSKGYCKPLEQPAPQLLGERVQIGTCISGGLDRWVELVTELSCWLTALDHAARLNDAYTIRMNDYVFK